MNRRYVFRDLSGALRGYLVQDETGIRCSASLSQDAQLVVLHGGTQAARFDLEAGTGERMLAPCEKKIEGGYVADHGGVILSTDEEARRAWRRIEAGRTMATGAIEAEKTPDMTPNEVQMASLSAENRSERDTLERRWPPPPCMPGSRYDQGKWKPAVRESDDS